MVAALAALGVLVTSSGCAGGSADPVASADSGTPSGHSTTADSPSPSSDTALPLAVRGLEPCPGDHDHPFSFKVGDYRVSGFTRGKGTRVAILSHQFRGTPCDLAGVGAGLDRMGWRVVAWTALPDADLAPLRALIAREREAGARRLVLVGASIGAAQSLTTAVEVRPRADAVVALSPPDQYAEQGDVVRAVRRFDGPIMVVAGEDDTGFGEVPDELAAAHLGPETIITVPASSDHGRTFVGRRTDPVFVKLMDFVRHHG